MFDVLMLEDATQWPRNELLEALDELTSGPTSFGHMPEWSEWLPYLIARIAPLVGTQNFDVVYEPLVSAIMVHYPDEEAEYHYPGFRSDMLATVGRALFQPHLWRNGCIIPGGTLTALEHVVGGHRLNPGGSFSAALFFVTKYLDPSLFAGWFASVTAIEDTFWRANLIVWLFTGSSLLLQAGTQPTDLPDDWHGADWTNSWHIKGAIPNDGNHLDLIKTPFLQPYRQALLKRAIRATVRVSDLEKWRDALVRTEQTHNLDLEYATWQYDEAIKHVVPQYDLLEA